MNSNEVNKIICGDCMETMRGMGNKKVHPTQKPLELIQELIIASGDIGDLVFDPCMGSGTTAVAAIKTERNFSGCEISKEYCKVAAERVMQEAL